MYLSAQTPRETSVFRSLRDTKHFRFLLRAITLCALTLGTFAARAQTSVTLGWNQSASSVAGYRVYQGMASGVYTTNFDAGKNLQLQITGLTPGATYYFAVAAYTSAGVYSDYSSELSFTANSSGLPAPVVNLTPGASTPVFPSAATITPPFVISGGLISQPLTTGVAAGGSAVYQISNSIPGNYLFTVWVKAPDTNSNSFYVNVDSQPTDPTMIWNVPVSTALLPRVVTWQGISDTAPKIFFLSAGTHQIIIRGREANTQLQALWISSAPFDIQLLPNKQIYLSGFAQTSHTYQIQTTTNFVNWTTLTTVTTDATGQFSYTDTAAPTVKARYYRLKG
jgi:hypothetical protein